MELTKEKQWQLFMSIANANKLNLSKKIDFDIARSMYKKVVDQNGLDSSIPDCVVSAFESDSENTEC